MPLAQQSGASPDFKTGVTAVLLEKTKGRPAWSPSTVEEVNDSDIKTKFFGQFSPSEGTAPSIEVPTDLPIDAEKAGRLAMRYALPTEAEIRLFVKGDHPASGGSKITKEELVKRFNILRNGKIGVTEKVTEVAARKCIEVEDKASGMKFLEWKEF